MVIKKLIYLTRNYILLIIQFAIAPLYVVITMLMYSLNENAKLPALAISFKEYLETVTTIEKGSLTIGSIAEHIFISYLDMFKNIYSPTHKLSIVEKKFAVEILNQYDISKSKTNLNFMTGATFTDDSLTVWFNNQAFHTAPLTLNLMNNAILK